MEHPQSLKTKVNNCTLVSATTVLWPLAAVYYFTMKWCHDAHLVKAWTYWNRKLLDRQRKKRLKQTRFQRTYRSEVPSVSIHIWKNGNKFQVTLRWQHTLLSHSAIWPFLRTSFPLGSSYQFVCFRPELPDALQDVTTRTDSTLQPSKFIPVSWHLKCQQLEYQNEREKPGSHINLISSLSLRSY